MLEVKIAKIGAYVYRSLINVSLKMVDVREKAAEKKKNAQYDLAGMLDKTANTASVEANELREDADKDFSKATLKVNAARNVLENAFDDVDYLVNQN